MLDKDEKAKIEHITALKDKLFEFQNDGGTWDENDLLPSGSRYDYEEMANEMIVIVYSAGYMALSKKAFEYLDLPESVIVLPKSNGLTGIKGSKIPGSSKIGNAESYPKDNVYRFSNRAFVRYLRIFDKDKRMYFLGVPSKDGYLVIDTTNPCREVSTGK
jgi:hypothetical protein